MTNFTRWYVVFLTIGARMRTGISFFGMHLSFIKLIFSFEIAIIRKTLREDITMPKAVIWDLDGTLLDSYDMILASLMQLLEENSIASDRESILDYILTYSVTDFLRMTASQYSISFDELSSRYWTILAGNDYRINPMKNASEILMHLSGKGVLNFVYTHKRESAISVLETMNLRQFFTEVLTAADGFERKPSPQAVLYFIDKYALEKDSTFYVGDRDLDILCAKNAGIKSIFFRSGKDYTVNSDYVVYDLLEINEIV